MQPSFKKLLEITRCFLIFPSMHLRHPLIRCCSSAIVVLTLIGWVGYPLCAASYINPQSFQIDAIIPPPPKLGTEEYKLDSGFLKDARAASTREQFDRGMTASHDGVFDFSQSLGSWFCSRNLPISTKLFDKVNQETKKAIDVAKEHFMRGRPPTWKVTGDIEKSDGFSYPSGYATRAFVWAILLSDAFPDMKKALHMQARQKAWYRVILGRHFPYDVHAGKGYGRFLSEQFLKSPEFKKAWARACAEMREVRRRNTQHLVVPTSPPVARPCVSATSNR